MVPLLPNAPFCVPLFAKVGAAVTPCCWPLDAVLPNEKEGLGCCAVVPDCGLLNEKLGLEVMFPPVVLPNEKLGLVSLLIASCFPKVKLGLVAVVSVVLLLKLNVGLGGSLEVLVLFPKENVGLVPLLAIVLPPKENPEGLSLCLFSPSVVCSLDLPSRVEGAVKAVEPLAEGTLSEGFLTEKEKAACCPLPSTTDLSVVVL